MNLFDISLYKDYVDKSIKNIVGVETLKDKSILITGSTGLICSTIIDQLIIVNKNHQFGVKIYACARNEEGLKKRFGTYVDNENIVYVPYDANKDIDFNFSVDYIIHGASNASPDLYISNPVDTMLSNFLGMKNLLDYALKKSVKSVVYVSSSEVYGKKENHTPYQEDEYGYVNILDVRSSYSSSKRATETLCKSYSEQYGIAIKIVRPGHIYGPRLKITDKRISSAFMYDAIRGQNLVMKSKGEQLRSYCHSLDCASAILTVLLQGQSGDAYNISNKKSIISIREMASIIAEVAGVKLLFELPNELEEKQKNPMDNSSLDSTKLEKLGWVGMFEAKEGLESTYKILDRSKIKRTS